MAPGLATISGGSNGGGAEGSGLGGRPWSACSRPSAGAQIFRLSEICFFRFRDLQKSPGAVAFGRLISPIESTLTELWSDPTVAANGGQKLDKGAVKNRLL